MSANTAGVFIQELRLVNEEGAEVYKFPYPTRVMRYPVHKGWIVSTVVGDGGSYAVSQSFVPDPEHDWTPTLAADDQQEQSAPTADFPQLTDNKPAPALQS